MWKGIWSKLQKLFNDDQYEDRQDMLERLEERLQQALEEQQKENEEGSSSNLATTTTATTNVVKKDMPVLLNRLEKIKENCKESIEREQLGNSLELTEMLEDNPDNSDNLFIGIEEEQREELLHEQKEEAQLQRLQNV